MRSIPSTAPPKCLEVGGVAQRYSACLAHRKPWVQISASLIKINGCEALFSSVERSDLIPSALSTSTCPWGGAWPHIPHPGRAPAPPSGCRPLWSWGRGGQWAACLGSGWGQGMESAFFLVCLHSTSTCQVGISKVKRQKE